MGDPPCNILQKLPKRSAKKVKMSSTNAQRDTIL